MAVNGKAVTGWLTAENGRYHYYFTKDGLMVSGKWLQSDGKWYYFYYEVDENGVKKTE